MNKSMEPRRISSPEQLVNIYGRDGAVMNDLIKKGLGDFTDQSVELVDLWSDMFEDRALCIQAVSIALMGAIYKHVTALQELREELGSNHAVEANIQTIKSSLEEIIKGI